MLQLYVYIEAVSMLAVMSSMMLTGDLGNLTIHTTSDERINSDSTMIRPLG